MTKQIIPDNALDDRLGFVGTSGSGKTYTAMGRIERLLDKGARACIVDPLGVWWGLRLQPDRKTPSRFATAPEGSPKRVVIFGGAHGDLPLTEHSGKLIGETVAGMSESCILDLSEIGTAAGERRFMLAFLTALYRKTSKEPRHLIIDEADMFAPQKVLDKEGEANKLLGMVQTVVRRGRIKGFIPWLITQRPAEISKGVLSQIDGMSVGKLTASQDINAIGAWVSSSADEGKWSDVKGLMPTMSVGQSLVWLPGHGIFNTFQFPEKSTFDSSRAPKRGEKVETANLKPLDLGKLEKLLATVDAEVKASDPKALKAEVARLRAELAKKPVQVPAPAPTVDKRATERARREGYDMGMQDAVTSLQPVIDQVCEAANGVAAGWKETDKAAVALRRWPSEFLKSRKSKPIPEPAPPAVNSKPASTPALQRSNPAPVGVSAGDRDISPAQQKICRGIATWAALGHEQPTREMVAAITGYSASSGGFKNYLSGLKTHGIIDYPETGKVSLTGHFDSMSAAEAVAALKSSLTPAQLRLIESVHASHECSRDQLAGATGYEATSGGFKNYLSSLKTLGIFTYPSTGRIDLSGWARELLG